MLKEKRDDGERERRRDRPVSVRRIVGIWRICATWPFRLADECSRLSNLEWLFGISDTHWSPADRLDEDILFDHAMLFSITFENVRPGVIQIGVIPRAGVARLPETFQFVLEGEESNVSSLIFAGSELTSFSSRLRRLSASNMSDLISAACFCMISSSHCFFNEAHWNEQRDENVSRALDRVSLTSSLRACLRNSRSSICSRARVNSAVGSNVSSLASVRISFRFVDSWPVIEERPRVIVLALLEFHQLAMFAGFHWQQSEEDGTRCDDDHTYCMLFSQHTMSHHVSLLDQSTRGVRCHYRSSFFRCECVPWRPLQIVCEQWQHLTHTARWISISRTCSPMSPSV